MNSHRVSFDSKTPLIYDLGANVGLVTLYYKQHYPNAIIKAFEPNPIIYKCLEKNIKLNNFQNVLTFNTAISYEEGFISFYCDKGGQVSSSIKPGDFDVELQKIPSINLKKLIDLEEQQIDLIKMDIEGTEVSVLKNCGASLQKVDRLVVEYHSYKKDKQELSQLLKILEDNGFRYVIKDVFSDFDLANINYNKSHFDAIIHVEAVQNKFFN